MSIVVGRDDLREKINKYIYVLRREYIYYGIDGTSSVR